MEIKNCRANWATSLFYDTIIEIVNQNLAWINWADIMIAKNPVTIMSILGPFLNKLILSEKKNFFLFVNSGR